MKEKLLNSELKELKGGNLEMAIGNEIEEVNNKNTSTGCRCFYNNRNPRSINTNSVEGCACSCK